MFFHIYAIFAMLALTLIALVRGASVLVLRRPVVVHTRWLLVGVLCVAVPLVIGRLQVLRTAGGPNGGLSVLVFLAIWCGAVALRVRRSAGYAIYGAAKRGLLPSLLNTLDELGLTYEKQGQDILLVESGAILKLTGGGMGAARLKTSRSGNSALMRQIAARLRRQYRTTPVPMNYTFNVIMTLVSFLLASLIWLRLTHVMPMP